MKSKLKNILSAMAIGFLSSTFAIAQNEDNNRIVSAAGDMYVISAKAGGVNFVEGQAGIVRKKGKSGQLLKGDSVEVGDRVSTGTNGKAEILLNPGSFLRLGGDSAFQFSSTDLEKLNIKFDRGSAIFEVFADQEYRVMVDTPKANFYLIESGVFRVDISADGTETIEVWRGKAQIGDAAGTIVKGGKSATILNGKLSVAKFDRDEKDSLDLWSKERGKALAKINDKLQKSLLRNSLQSSFMNRRWGFGDSFGLWVYNPAFGSFCFVPFGYGWRSPYGYGYGYNAWNYYRDWWNYPIYPPVVNPPVVTPPNNQPTVNPQINADRRANLHTPPFMRIQQAESRGSGGFGNSGGYDSSGDSRGSGGGRMSAPTYSPPAASPPPPPPIANARGGETRGGN